VRTHPLVADRVRTFKAEGRIVTVGAWLGGLATAEALRDEGFTGSADHHWRRGVHEPRDRPPLSKQVLKGWVPRG
jgi:3-phenylpropionate/trans-cinnamate dioxygenase ferredoxin reductase subunit